MIRVTSSSFSTHTNPLLWSTLLLYPLEGCYDTLQYYNRYILVKAAMVPILGEAVLHYYYQESGNRKIATQI